MIGGGGNAKEEEGAKKGRVKVEVRRGGDSAHKEGGVRT